MRIATTAGAAWLALTFGTAGCAPGDEGDERDRGGTPDGRDEGAPIEDDATEPPDSAEPEGREIPDYAFDNVCGTEDLPVEYSVSSDMLIVLDRSGSMMGTLDPLKTAINTIVDASDDRMWFGLMPFPNSVPPDECRLLAPRTVCLAPSEPHVPLGSFTAAPIAEALAGIVACGNTPTAGTLSSALEYLRGAGTGHTPYVLLVTDGVPNCNYSLDPDTCTCSDPSADPGCGGDPGACLDDTRTYAAVDDLLTEGVKTYVMALGRWEGTNREVVDTMAVRGGTEHFYPAEDPGAMLSTFEDILGTIVLSCRFDLHPGGDVDPTEVNMYVGGEMVPRDPSHTNGWDYVDEDTVEFYGPICDSILAGETTAVSAAYGCPTWII